MKKDFASRELTVEGVVGGFVVLILFGLAYFTFMLSGKKLGERTYRMEVVFRDVMGLRPKDTVVVRGMPVGEVKALTLKPDGVHVTLSLTGRRGEPPPVQMRQDYRIAIVATTILGGRMLVIHEGSADKEAIPLDTLFQGRDPHDLMEDATELFSALRQGLTEKGGVLESLKEAAAQIRDITQRLNAGKGTLGKLLSDDDTLYRDLCSGVASFKALLERIEQGKGTAGKLLSEDATLYDDLKGTLASLRAITERLEQGKSTLGRLLSEDDRLYQDLRATVASLRAVADRLEQGKSTLGRLLAADDTLYREFADVVQEAKAALDDLRETTPVVTFTSILFGAF